MSNSEMVRCKNCGEEVPVQVVVKEKKVEVEVGEEAFWLRIWKIVGTAIVLIAAIIVSGVCYCERIESEELKALLDDPSVEVEIQEIPNSSPIRKFTRRRP